MHAPLQVGALVHRTHLATGLSISLYKLNCLLRPRADLRPTRAALNIV